MGFDWTVFAKDEVLEDHVEKPIKIETLIKDFSQKFDIRIKAEIQAFKRKEE